MIKKYFILAWGCQMNTSDAEKIANILSSLGYLKTDRENSADLIVAVACSIKQSAIDRVYGKAHNWQKRRRQGDLVTVLTGCVLDKDKKKLANIFDLVLSIKDIDQLPNKLALPPKVKAIKIKDYFNIQPKYNSKFQAYVPIMTGCNNFCTFCVVPYTRGREIYRPAEEIIRECRRLIKNGYKEITLLGQNVNSYHSYLPLPEGETAQSARGGGRRRLWFFPQLLAEIDKIPGDYWIRFLSSNPQDISGDLITVMKKGRHITPYLHFAIQSGDDDILKKMKRRHSVAHYLQIIKRARQAMPELMVSTDIIVGFPTETRKQFNNSLQIAKEVGYDMIYIGKYSHRLGTPAAKTFKDNVAKVEKVRRERALTEVLKKTALANNRKYLNQVVRVLVEGKNNDQYYGKTATFKTVTFKSQKNIIGQFVEVKITKVGSWGLDGELI